MSSNVVDRKSERYTPADVQKKYHAQSLLLSNTIFKLGLGHLKASVV